MDAAAIAVLIASIEGVLRISLMLQKAQAENRNLNEEEWKEINGMFDKAKADAEALYKTL